MHASQASPCNRPYAVQCADHYRQTVLYIQSRSSKSRRRMVANSMHVARLVLQRLCERLHCLATGSLPSLPARHLHRRPPCARRRGCQPAAPLRQGQARQLPASRQITWQLLNLPLNFHHLCTADCRRWSIRCSLSLAMAKRISTTPPRTL